MIVVVFLQILFTPLNSGCWCTVVSVCVFQTIDSCRFYLEIPVPCCQSLIVDLCRETLEVKRATQCEAINLLT